jgi:hypothetical protein
VGMNRKAVWAGIGRGREGGGQWAGVGLGRKGAGSRGQRGQEVGRVISRWGKWWAGNTEKLCRCNKFSRSALAVRTHSYSLPVHLQFCGFPFMCSFWCGALCILILTKY